MPSYRLAFNPQTLTAWLMEPEVIEPLGADDLGIFEHNSPDNHALYHHVQATLYQLGYWDMRLITIRWFTPIPDPEPEDPEEQPPTTLVSVL